MKKLEDIPKKNIFEVPEGYFEKLPGIIQARVAQPERATRWMPVLKYALPVAALLVIGFFWFTPEPKSFEDQLSSIQTDQLVAYLANTELRTEVLMENIVLSEEDLMDLEETVYGSLDIDYELDLLLDTEEYSEPLENF